MVKYIKSTVTIGGNDVVHIIDGADYLTPEQPTATVDPQVNHDAMESWIEAIYASIQAGKNTRGVLSGGTYRVGRRSAGVPLQDAGGIRCRPGVKLDMTGVTFWCSYAEFSSRDVIQRGTFVNYIPRNPGDEGYGEDWDPEDHPINGFGIKGLRMYEDATPIPDPENTEEFLPWSWEGNVFHLFGNDITLEDVWADGYASDFGGRFFQGGGTFRVRFPGGSSAPGVSYLNNSDPALNGRGLNRVAFPEGFALSSFDEGIRMVIFLDGDVTPLRGRISDILEPAIPSGPTPSVVSQTLWTCRLVDNNGDDITIPTDVDGNEAWIDRCGSGPDINNCFFRDGHGANFNLQKGGAGVRITHGGGRVRNSVAAVSGDDCPLQAAPYDADDRTVDGVEFSGIRLAGAAFARTFLVNAGPQARRLDYPGSETCAPWHDTRRVVIRDIPLMHAGGESILISHDGCIDEEGDFDDVQPDVGYGRVWGIEMINLDIHKGASSPESGRGRGSTGCRVMAKDGGVVRDVKAINVNFRAPLYEVLKIIGDVEDFTAIGGRWEGPRQDGIPTIALDGAGCLLKLMGTIIAAPASGAPAVDFQGDPPAGSVGKLRAIGCTFAEINGGQSAIRHSGGYTVWVGGTDFIRRKGSATGQAYAYETAGDAGSLQFTSDNSYLGVKKLNRTDPMTTVVESGMWVQKITVLATDAYEWIPPTTFGVGDARCLSSSMRFAWSTGGSPHIDDGEIIGTIFGSSSMGEDLNISAASGKVIFTNTTASDIDFSLIYLNRD